jgi:hypothetical protein
MNTLSEQNESRCSETNTAADGDKRVNEFGDGCGHASTMCRPVLACVRKNFFTSPLCTTVCVCEKTLRLFEQTIHFELTAAPPPMPPMHVCVRTQTSNSGRRRMSYATFAAIQRYRTVWATLRSLGPIGSLSFITSPIRIGDVINN